MRLAYLGFPHTGGTHTVYQFLRKGLEQHGIEVRWVSANPRADGLRDDPTWDHEADHGELPAVGLATSKQRGAALVNHIERAGYDGVFVNVLINPIDMNSARYLSADILKVGIVHNITIGTYKAALGVRDYLHQSVGVSPRIGRDLVEKYGFNLSRTRCIYNAIDLAPYRDASRSPRLGPLRVLSLGRISDDAKGVFWLPKILSRLGTGVDVELTVVGDGPDLAQLKLRCAEFGTRVRFIGRVDNAEVPGIAADHDVFLMPSRYEGIGLTLIEMMAAGCVPVASLLRGVSDSVVQHGENGLLFRVGDVEDAAGHIGRIASNADLLRAMSCNAKQSIHTSFDVAHQADSYRQVLDEARGVDPALLAEPLLLAGWKLPREFRPGWRRFVPERIKRELRGRRER